MKKVSAPNVIKILCTKNGNLSDVIVYISSKMNLSNTILLYIRKLSYKIYQ